MYLSLFQWRLRCFWKYLRETCDIAYEQMELLWEEMKDVVIKTLLISHKGTVTENIFRFHLFTLKNTNVKKI